MTAEVLLTNEFYFLYNGNPLDSIANLATTGHPDEAQMREKLDNAFYDGTMTDPVNFLEANGIAAVLIWPEDKLSDEFITKMKRELASGYAYVDCKMDGTANAGIFLKKLDP